MPEPDNTPGNPPESPTEMQNAADVAALAEAYLDLWQRNIAAWAADPRSGPPLTAVDRLARDWLSKHRRDAP